MADCDGVLALFWNPAALGGAGGRNLLFSYNRFELDISQSLLAYSQSGFGLGVNYVGVGGIKVRSGPTDEPEGMTEAWDLAFYGGYGRRLPGNLSLGLAGKLIREKLHEYEASTLAFDVGMGYEHGNFKLGAALRNLSEGVKFREERFRLPIMVKLGAVLSFLGKRLTLAADLDQPLLEGNRRKLHLGAELVLKEILFLRGGYNYQPKNRELGGLAGLTTGVGLDYGGLGIGYTFAPSESMGDIHQISMSVDLDRVVPTPQPPKPPVIYIISPSDGQVVEGGYVDVTGSAEDDKGIAYLEIWVNGEMWSSKRGPVLDKGDRDRGVRIISKLRFSERVKLDRWSNTIDIIAYDTDGLSTKKSVVPIISGKTWSGSGEYTYAVIVGISEYESRDIPKLNYAHKDAEAFKKFLMSYQGGSVPEENIKFFINEDATKEEIKSALLEWLPKNANTDMHTVIIFYAGHGIIHRFTKEGLFVTYRSNPDMWIGTTLEMEDVRKAFDTIKAGRILFFSDACHGGIVTERLAYRFREVEDLGGHHLIDWLSGTGRVIITASMAGEKSMELDEYEHGLFTYFLLEGLRGKADKRESGGDDNGWVDIDEVYNYTYDKVKDKSGDRQHPTWRIEEGVGKIYLSKLERKEGLKKD